ncbi:MAG: hypothetical protein AB1782_21025 [Cyanobacteriota bacterium]
MPAISPVSQTVTQKVSFAAAKPIQWDNDPQSALKRFESGKGDAWKSSGKGKKLVGLTALAAIIAGVVLHKVPADKLPKILAPAKKWVGDMLARVQGMISKKAPEATEQAQKLLTAG